MLTKHFKKNFCRYLGLKGQEEDIVRTEFQIHDWGSVAAGIFSKSTKEIGNCSSHNITKEDSKLYL